MVEMVLLVAHLFMRYGSKECRMEGIVGMLELRETDYRNVKCAWDGGIAVAARGNPGVSVQVLRE